MTLRALCFFASQGCYAALFAAQVGSFLSAVVFGYVAKISGSYDLPLILRRRYLASVL